MIKAIKNCIKNSDYTESEKTQMLAWIECAIDFGKNLDEVAKENEQLKAENEQLKEQLKNLLVIPAARKDIKLYAYDISKVLDPLMTGKARIGMHGYFADSYTMLEQAFIYGQTAELKKVTRERYINDEGRKFTYFLPIEVEE